MKYRNENPRNTLNLGSLCPNEYWEQLSNNTQKEK
jgi:hypothetical protein